VGDKSGPVVVIGGTGMLGSDLLKVLGEKYEMRGAGSRDVDIRDIESVRRFIGKFSPRTVINAAAYTDVDGAERNPEKAYAVNARGAANVARAAVEHGSKVIHYSSDYVFDGKAEKPYTEEDEPNPLGTYARSKKEGEEEVINRAPSALVIRTAWLYGTNGKNFVETVINVSRKEKELAVVNDQEGSPTWTVHLARATGKLMEAGAEGIVHVTNSGRVTWFGFAKRILERIGSAAEVKPIASDALGRPARRPAWSVLDNSRYEKLTGDRLPHWEEALKDYLEERAE